MLSHTNFWTETENPPPPPYIYGLNLCERLCLWFTVLLMYPKCIDECMSPFLSRGDSGKDWQRQQSFQRHKRKKVQDGYAQGSPGKEGQTADKLTNLHIVALNEQPCVVLWTSFNGRSLNCSDLQLPCLERLVWIWIAKYAKTLWKTSFCRLRKWGCSDASSEFPKKNLLRTHMFWQF